MKRALLVAGGTVGGLGAVLAITPPQLGANSVGTLSGAAAANSNNQVAAESATKVATDKSSVVAPKKASATTKKKSASNSPSTNTNTNSNSNSDTGSNAGSNTGASNGAVSGSFTGDPFDVSYGIVQVKITLSNGKITEAVALQAPAGRSQRFSDYAIPNLRSQTLSAQSAAISGVSGASYTSYGWYKSLISALQKAGMATGV